jgi:hypothetical protein
MLELFFLLTTITLGVIVVVHDMYEERKHLDD